MFICWLFRGEVLPFRAVRMDLWCQNAMTPASSNRQSGANYRSPLSSSDTAWRAPSRSSVASCRPVAQAGEDMLDACPWLSDAGAPLLGTGKWLILVALALDMHAPAFALEPRFALPVNVVLVGVNVAAGVGRGRSASRSAACRVADGADLDLRLPRSAPRIAIPGLAIDLFAVR